jgi:hypothetical protein
MQIKLMAFFEEFADSVMTGKEYDLFRVQAIALAFEKDRTRHFEKVIKGPNRVLVLNYYLSLKLDALFVLTAHIQRGGEPREKEKQALQKYIAELKTLEGES